MNSSDYTFVTTCKGRLHHLRQTLPTLVKTNCAAVVVVDYQCPDRTGDWVEEHHPQVTVVRVTDDARFCLARARNIGAGFVKTPWIVFIDADVLVHDGWDAWLTNHLTPGALFRASPINGKLAAETYGTCICEKSAFDRLGGYDESFTGWSGEDIDLYRRLNGALIAQKWYPETLVSAISHGDDERTTFSAIKDTGLHRIIGELYMRAKTFYTGFLDPGRQMSLDERKQLMALIVERVQAWDRAGRPVSTNIELQHQSVRWLPPPYGMGLTATLRLTIGAQKNLKRVPDKA